MPELDERLGDFNTGEEKAPAGAGQPGNNAPASNPDAEALNHEIDEHLSKGELKDEELAKIGVESVDEGDDTVVLPKKQVEALKRDLGNYRTGLISAKKKIDPLLKTKKQETPAQPPANQPKETEQGDVMKRSEYIKSVQKSAITAASRDPFTDKHWKGIMPFYVARHGQDTVEGTVIDIEDAKTLYLKKHPELQQEADDLASKAKAAEMGSDRGAPAGPGEGGGNNQERRHILPRKTSVKDWYPPKKKE